MSIRNTNPLNDALHKSIKSYVLRAGRLTTGQKRALEDLWPIYGINLEDHSGLLDLPEIFSTSAPVTLEIGFGNGENVVSMAAAAPDTCFLGVEVHRPGVGHCLLGIEKHNLKNLRVVCHDAVDLLKNHLTDSSLARVNLFFPDPWHKKRHNKRRIVQPDFMQLLARKLEPGGLFHVVTDWPHYADHILEVLEQAQEFERLFSAPDDRNVTRFDTRGQRLGHSNWEQAWRNCSKLPIQS